MALKKPSQLNVQCQFCKSKAGSHFADLPDSDLEVLSAHKSCITYKKGQNLFYEGTRPMGIFCINVGKVKVYKMGSNGKEQILFIAQPGDFLGYRSLLSEEFYGASATVIEQAAICFIPKSDFLSILNTNPAFFQKLMKAVCHELGVMETKLAELSQKSVRERLAATILMLKETYGMEGEDSDLIDIALSREDLANIVGTATETVIRLLSEFKSDGLIGLVGKKIKVVDTEKLIHEADFYA
ncbi:Crp/Fnr family transcriptional regulator [Roseivirga misakiensis]|uniref:Transcriptional regulator n=1 Tax=Roseivirga misakiensis TaxID=1563681 RepID=A0A1E5SKY5_9BACT|nr:Crp/Fnr family transcriptional regulator [Roseivirga misakiensis]OEJ99782.1 transcriptional regulator [Roseivirga misakiensis]